MIAASEPLEFIPRGRIAVDQHPKPDSVNDPIPNSHVTLSDNFLLHRLENISLSSSESSSEFWKIEDLERDERIKDSFLEGLQNGTEHEIYVRGQTAVWTKGFSVDTGTIPQISFTLESPIKFAFKCPNHFIKLDSKIRKFDEKNELKSSYYLPQDNLREVNGLCFIDSTSIKVYMDNGEDLVSSLEFPVSNVWLLKSSIILEKEASVACFDDHSVVLPRLFSLGHPMDELCPIIIKHSPDDHVQFFSETEQKVIFTDGSQNYLLIYDSKIERNCVYKMRSASKDEIRYVAETAEEQTDLFSMNTTSKVMPSTTSIYLKSSSKFLHSSFNVGKSGSMANTSHNIGHRSRYQSPLASTSNYPKSPMSRLQSSVRRSSISVKDARILGQAEKSKPIEPKYCLERVWVEILTPDAIRDISKEGFYHTDCLGRTYLCYHLPIQGKLQLLELVNKSGMTTFEHVGSIPAKCALPIKKLNMVAVLDHSGTLLLYTGNVFMAKVHIGGVLSNLATSEHFTPPNFPRRSTLLPTVLPESKFDEDFHLLSPVTPISGFNKNIFMSKTTGYCIGLRDPAGNRLNLVCQGNRIYRISLPKFSESRLISRTLKALREALPKFLATTLIVKWYGIRNAPGTSDYSPKKEWFMFKNALLGLLGRPPVALDADSNNSSSSEKPRKRRKGEAEDQGSDRDWEFLLNTKYGRRNINIPSYSEKSPGKSMELIEQLPAIFKTLHLLYEDLKLDSSMSDSMESLREFLCEMAIDCNLEKYVIYYCLDYPKLTKLLPRVFDNTPQQGFEEINLGSIPNIYGLIYDKILCEENKNGYSYPHIKHVNNLTQKILVFLYKFYGNKSISFNYNTTTNDKNVRPVTKVKNPYLGMSWNIIEQLPFGVKFLVIQVLLKDREKPKIGLEKSAYELMRRPDLKAHLKTENNFQKSASFNKQNEESLTKREEILTPSQSENSTEITNGMENIDTLLLRLRFAKDLRIIEARKLLDSESPVPIDVVQGPNVTDHDFIEEKERQLYALCTRTMALSIGRGMFTLRTTAPVSTKSLPVPSLCLTGEEVQNGATVDLTQIDVPSNMNLWPQFHNGVAAGLKIAPEAKDVDSTWIVYNKPKMYTSTEHSGFLMALGLNQHLRSLSFMSIYDYLVRCDEMTSIGLLLGISAAHCGSLDNSITKILSVHIEALLPPTALELEIQQNVRIAALMGIGLVCQSSAKRHIAEILLQEIGRPPGPEMENSVERESYSLTAGLALGMVTLGLGETPTELQDLELADTLHYYMVGGNKRPIAGAQNEKYKLPSFQIREGDSVNIDVTAPGAILALGLMFCRTNNKAVANWMLPPDTTYLLDFVRPDILLLRIIARGLIMWDDVKPSKAWLNDQIPNILQFDLKRGPPIDESQPIDDEAYCQAYCSIVTGSIFCMGLKYAGTSDKQAYELMKETLNVFLSMGGQYVGEYAGKTTVESCLMVIVVSMALIFAGTGDLNVLRIVKSLRSRIGPTNTHVTYGSHMVLHMSLGFLFMGAGRFTLSTSPKAIAALVCALFPKFPIHSNDNRYHLQAFRHLYVLAIESRLFLPRDIDTGKLTLCQIRCIRLTGEQIHVIAPAILPELNELKSVIVDDSHYWQIRFDREKNWAQLKSLLDQGNCVDLKKRSGCLSLLDDPNRMKSILSKSMTDGHMDTWKIMDKTLKRISNTSFTDCFKDMFLHTDGTTGEQEKIIQRMVQNNYYHCLALDCVELFPTLTTYIETIMASIFKSEYSVRDIWQSKLITRGLRTTTASSLKAAPKEWLQSFDNKLGKNLQDALIGNKDLGTLILQFINNSSMDLIESIDPSMFNKIAAIFIYFDLIPLINQPALNMAVVNPLNMMIHLKEIGLNTKSVQFVWNVLIKK